MANKSFTTGIIIGIILVVAVFVLAFIFLTQTSSSSSGGIYDILRDIKPATIASPLAVIQVPFYIDSDEVRILDNQGSNGEDIIQFELVQNAGEILKVSDITLIGGGPSEGITCSWDKNNLDFISGVAYLITINCQDGNQFNIGEKFVADIKLSYNELDNPEEQKVTGNLKVIVK